MSRDQLGPTEPLDLDQKEGPIIALFGPSRKKRGCGIHRRMEMAKDILKTPMISPNGTFRLSGLDFFSFRFSAVPKTAEY